MRTKTLGILSVGMLLGLAFLPTSYAQDDDPVARDEHRGMRGPFGRGGSPERFIERHDTNADGQVSLSEFVDKHLERVDALFERRDADGDGLISLEENTPPERPRRHDRPDIDRDAAKACVEDTIAELAPGFEPDRGERFEDADTDGDGALSLAEVSARIEANAETQFARLDADANGVLTASEVEAHGATLHEARRTIRKCVRDQAI